ncbi:hypothetical protein CH63R_13450 [Colletotrichum higginsianum IMI 349063]|uniref:Uncharacterized protein n=1 Tax=Colletotrichum higginsianum (strain IMI 349063) TaxID=759273 RepID=A0A1B7XR79_COLHI|nr:hypothetical protein CH63R_13450 [Colletotrichum higginsianum IMI 349063]OBR02224.1 hypothetical protein CH63R_13450 [Colletotrichum higginsianum IMI 349063]
MTEVATPKAKQPADSDTGCYADAKGDGNKDLVCSHENALRRQRQRPQTTSHKGDNLECPELCAQMDKSEAGKTGKGWQFLKTTPVPTAPALVSLHEACVTEKAKKGQPKADVSCYRSSHHTKV